MICRHDCFEKLIVDDELENRGCVNTLIEKYKNKQIVVLVYYPQINEMIKRGHKSLIDTLNKMIDNNRER